VEASVEASMEAPTYFCGSGFHGTEPVEAMDESSGDSLKVLEGNYNRWKFAEANGSKF